MSHPSEPHLEARRRALLILNPGSRQGGNADLDTGLARLKESGTELESVKSQSPEESCEAIRERRTAVDLVIVGGGDGTVSSCIPALLDSGLPVAILPLGTANDLARSLGIENLDQAFEAICSGDTAKVDLGVVNAHYFFNVANLGLGVKVTEELTPEVKQRWGVLSYLKAFASALSRHRQFKLRIRVDGKEHAMRSIQLAVGNGRFYGGGNVVDQHATIDDNLLHIYSLRPQTVWELLTLAPLLRGGRHDLAKRTFSVSARELYVETKPEAMEIHADGEPVTQTPANFSVKSAALKMIVPKDSPLLGR
ncbi:lipid kinase [Microbulbifer sp. YPW1]|uniref:lipid kinase n=1 Tax=Microbulbifer sp. YPW1 TaxID=2745199 RepID=UPI0015986453|nr:lipid kinase [Microbulbifer sp. YPW1]QKX19092.1 lipid kinase [Microbulbifer sp. YPW1]